MVAQVIVDIGDQDVQHHPAIEFGGVAFGLGAGLRKGTTLTKDLFLNHFYGGMDEPELKIIDVFICKLRKKLPNSAYGKHHIETVWGRGYMLRDPDAAEVAA